MNDAKKDQARIIAASKRLLLIDREKFRVTLYERDRSDVKYGVVDQFPCAVGAIGHKTPRGAYVINSKVKDPDWMMPNSDWVAPELRGTIVKGGTDENPLKERWLGVTAPSEGVGIHGTADKDSIGSAASHGCIRMKPKDVIDLYEQVPIGTPAVIV